MTTSTRVACILAISLVASACSTGRIREIPEGHACIREFTNFGSGLSYACIFEMSGPSPYYRPGEVDKVIAEFMGQISSRCKLADRTEVIPNEAPVLSSATTYLVQRIECD